MPQEEEEHYITIEGSLEFLKKQVSRRINGGWDPVGAPVFVPGSATHGSVWVQAMQKKPSKTLKG